MEQAIRNLLQGYIVLMSLIGFILMGIDKRRAIRHAWRIPERTLILQAFIGGGPGSLFGMYLFRHKTKHNKFIVLLPLATILTLVVFVASAGLL